MRSADDMLPVYKVLVHKSLLDDSEIIDAITSYLWWGEFPEDVPVKCTRRRDQASYAGLLIFDPTDDRTHRRGAANGYIISDLMQW